MSEVPHDVRGSSLEIEISWFYYVVQEVLRAFSAETKVDGLPRALSICGSGGIFLLRDQEHDVRI